jgi:hypothetical protein
LSDANHLRRRSLVRGGDDAGQLRRLRQHTVSRIEEPLDLWSFRRLNLRAGIVIGIDERRVGILSFVARCVHVRLSLYIREYARPRVSAPLSPQRQQARRSEARHSPRRPCFQHGSPQKWVPSTFTS